MAHRQHFGAIARKRQTEPRRTNPAYGEVPLTRITGAIMGGTSVLLTGPGDMAPLLNEAARHLARTRVIRIRPPFGLPDFVGQVAALGTCHGASPKADHDETDVERAFRALTTLDAGCERTALLVEGAHHMPHSTLRYVEMALFTAAHLHVVLAGMPVLADTLALEGFVRLRNRVPVHVSLPDAAAPVLAHLPAGAAALPAPTALPSCPRGVSRPGLLAIRVLAGIAASVGLALLASQPMQAPHGAAAPVLSHAGMATGPSGADPPAIPAAAAVAPPALAPTPLPAMAAIATGAPAPVLPDAAPVPSAPAGADEPAGPLAASNAQAPDSAEPAPAPAAPPILAVAARPISPPRMQPRLVPIRPDRVTAERAPAANQDERRCRRIIQHLQLGEDPTDADRAFLRNGCR